MSMSAILLPGTLTTESEFPIPGVTGACGVTMAAMAESYASQAYISTQVMYARMRAANRCDRQGITVMDGIIKQLRADGLTVAHLGIAYPRAATWVAWMHARLGERAAVGFEPSNCQRLDRNGRIISGLQDLITGARMDAGSLDFHYILLVGYHPGGYSARAGKTLPEGCWVSDGDSDANNPVVNGRRTRVSQGHRLQFYSLAALIASAPYDLIAVYPRVTISGGVSVYTKLSDGRLQFKAGALGLGFSELYVSSGETGDLSIPETYYSQYESFARFTSGTVFHYDARTGKASIDTTGLVVDGLYSAWRLAQAEANKPAPAPVIKEVVPADLAAAFKTMAHYAQ